MSYSNILCTWYTTGFLLLATGVHRWSPLVPLHKHASQVKKRRQAIQKHRWLSQRWLRLSCLLVLLSEMASYARSFLGFLLVLLCSLSLVYGLGICAFGVYLAVRSSSGLQDLNTTCAGADSGSFFNCSLAPSTPHKSGDHLPIPGFTVSMYLQSVYCFSFSIHFLAFFNLLF